MSTQEERLAAPLVLVRWIDSMAIPKVAIVETTMLAAHPAPQGEVKG